MSARVLDSGWIAEATVFLNHFKMLPDPRQQAKVIYRLDELLLQSLLAVLAGAESFTDIARFGEKKLALLRRFLPFANGTAPHDRIGEIYAALDAGAFQRCFVDWVAGLTRTPVEVIAIDGKTSRGSRGKGAAGLHLVSAFAARQRLVLAQAKVAEKSNEIVAIPALLDLLSIEGAVVTIDAMGCQRDIAAKIVAKRADYILALKGNQGTLRDDVELFANEQKARAFTDTAISTHETVDADHGRVETRRYTVFHHLEWLRDRHDWPGLAGIIMVESERWTATKTERETRFYITSLTAKAERCGPMVRDHWAIVLRGPQDEERPPLGHGHDLPRRRMPRPYRPGTRQLRHAAPHRP